MADSVAFVPVCADDLPLPGERLAQPHRRAWWDAPGGESGHIRDMIEGRDSMRPFLFHARGQPAGYIRHWRVGDSKVGPWPTGAPWLALLDGDCRGVDLFIGPAGLLSQGLGSAVMAAFVTMLNSKGHGGLVMDSAPLNRRAIRACETAGFRAMPEMAGRWPGVHLMCHQAMRLPGM